MWHVEALANAQAASRLVLLGSSSVVNGIDSEILATRLGQNKNLTIHNLGLTGFLAYELPTMKRVVFTPNTRTVIFLYNGFSFGNEFYPDAVEIRWDTAEMLRIATSDQLNLSDWSLYASAFGREHM